MRIVQALFSVIFAYLIGVKCGAIFENSDVSRNENEIIARDVFQKTDPCRAEVTSRFCGKATYCTSNNSVDFQCTCQKGFYTTGVYYPVTSDLSFVERCDDIDECDDLEACPNTTVCVNTYGDFDCYCKDKHKKKQENSNPKVDGCEAPCKHNDDCKFFEKCNSSSEGNFCSCPNGKRGAQCEIVVDCEWKYRDCSGDVGQCVYNDEIEAAECNCTKGKKWDQRLRMCRTTCKDDCENSGKCEGDSDIKFCNCKSGTKGSFCEEVSNCVYGDFCGDNTDVKCVYDESVRGGVCRCDNPKKVFLREEMRCSMYCKNNDDCQVFEKCKGTSPGNLCICPNGTSGERCEIIYDCVEGKYTNCKGNNGQCVYNDEIEAAECICRKGQKWNEQLESCRTTTPCNPNPCKNDGWCSSDGVNAKCTCRSGYIGETCEIGGNCVDYTCQNGGICIPSHAGIPRCYCEAPFSGNRCEKKDMCASNPCKNGGTCEEMGNSYKCICLLKYYGKSCESYKSAALFTTLVLIAVVVFCLFIVICIGCCLLKSNQKLKKVFQNRGFYKNNLQMKNIFQNPENYEHFNGAP